MGLGGRVGSGGGSVGVSTFTHLHRGKLIKLDYSVLVTLRYQTILGGGSGVGSSGGGNVGVGTFT